MDLFAASGIDLPRSGGPARRTAAPRSPRTPLFAHKVVEEAIGRSAFAPDDALLKVTVHPPRSVAAVL